MSASDLTTGPPGGFQLGRYRIHRPIGMGGMGVVYEAYEHSSGRRVALKTLLKLEPNAILRFKREFRALQNIHHDNLVRLYDLSVFDDVWCFTMEYIDGIDLLRHVRPGRLVESVMAFASTEGFDVTMTGSDADVRSDSRARVKVRAPALTGPGEAG